MGCDKYRLVGDARARTRLFPDLTDLGVAFARAALRQINTARVTKRRRASTHDRSKHYERVAF